MQTEIEKFDQINQYLKGTLSEDARIQFEAEINADPTLQSEIEMHRLLNDTIVDNYLLEVKQKTKKVFQQKKTNQNRKNWTIGLGSIILAGTIFVAYNQFDKTIAATKTSLTNEKLPTKKPYDEQKSQTISQTKVELNESLNTIKEPTKPNYITKEPVFEKPIETEIIPKTISEEHATFSTVQAKPENPDQKLEETNSIKLKASEKTIEKLEKQTELKLREDIQLILNMSRNELVTFPIEEGFDGRLEILNGNGIEIWQQNIVGGQPATWDGTAQAGGQVSSGQYVFILKSNEGQIVKQGFITVVR